MREEPASLPEGINKQYSLVLQGGNPGLVFVQAFI
jgi:hypothetical protein